MAQVLIIDDDPGICQTLSAMVKRENHEVKYTHTLEEGVYFAVEGLYDVVFLDVNMPDGNGLKHLSEIMKSQSSPEVIIITGQGDPDGAELAMRNGAWDYIQKPSSIKKMTLPFLRALQYRKEKQASTSAKSLNRKGIIGSSPEILSSLDQVATASSSDGNVLITGETGTGKELFAQAIHANSARCNENYVVVDCAALPESLVESTLFGIEKGAFTGADRTKQGLVAHADRGTILLDELGELPLSVQKKFLRVIQEKRFRPVGSKREVTSDFRVLATTNRDLDTLVQKGRFRRDLLFRLGTFHITLPPLRKRRKDIKEIAMFHMSRLCERVNTGIKGFSPDFIQAIADYEWPGNVRELVNAMERAIAVSGPEPTLFAKHLPDSIRVALARNQVQAMVPIPPQGEHVSFAPDHFPRFREFREEAIAQMEQNYLEALLERTSRNVRKACQVSGIGKSRIYELIKKYGLMEPAG